MTDNFIPEGFIPIVTVGEKDGYLMVFTTEGHDYTIEILERTIDVLRESDKDQEMTLQ
jgi:hypothetical protein